MIIHYLSASRLKTYLQCTEKYHQSYEKGVRGEADHLKFGTLMHRVFERWFQESLSMEDIFGEEWIKADIASIEYYRDAFDIMQIFAERNNRDEIIPMGFEYAFAINIENFTTYDAHLVDFSNKDEARGFLEMLEKKDEPIIFGFIDRIDHVDDDSLRIVDYKTSRVPLTQYEANEDEQMSMYALVASILFPEYANVSLELHYVRHGVEMRTRRSAEENELFRNWLLSMYQKIKTDNSPEAKLNRYCGWCDARFGCKGYLELVNGEADPDFDVDKIDFEQMDAELERINIHMKILDGRKKELEGKFKEALKNSDNAPINVGGAERYVTANVRTSYDPFTVINVFDVDQLPDLLTVNKSAVDKLIKGQPELERALGETATQHFIAPTLRKKKTKK